MSRVLKFRAWDKLDKRMIVHEQDFFPLKVTSVGVLRLTPSLREENWVLLPIDRFELMQFTGLLDKNGKEIYEGDIVKDVFETGKPQIVTYDEDRFIVKGTGIRVSSFAAHQQIEVIGNIYENPNLLK